MGIRRRVHHHAAPGKRLHFVADAAQQLAVRLDRLELGSGELERQRQQQSLGRRPITGELMHRPFVQHALVRRVLIDDRNAGVGLEDDVGVEDLKDRCQVPGVGCPGVARKHLESGAGAAEPRHLKPDTYGSAPSPQGNGGGEGPERPPHRLLHDFLDEELVAEPDDRRAIARRDGGAIAGFRGAHDERVANRAAPHEHVALPAGGLGLRRPLHEPA